MYGTIERLFEGGFTCKLRASDPLFHTGDLISRMFLVLDGEIVLIRQTGSGIELRLQSARQGQVVAEASAYSDVYHCDARASRNATVCAVAVGTFRSRLRDNQDVADAWAAYLGRAVQAARTGAEIRTLRAVAERLDAWLGEGRRIPAKGNWTELAAELGVSREALYREFRKRRQGS